MTLDIAILDEIFANYTIEKVEALAMSQYGDREHGDVPITVFASVDDDEDGSVNDIAAITIQHETDLARALVSILMNFGPPDWVAIAADTFCQDGVGEMPTQPYPLQPLFEDGDPSVHEELLLLAIHRCGDGVQIHRKYVVSDGCVDMDITKWTGSPPDHRMGYIWDELERFMDLLAKINGILENADAN